MSPSRQSAPAFCLALLLVFPLVLAAQEAGTSVSTGSPGVPPSVAADSLSLEQAVYLALTRNERARAADEVMDAADKSVLRARSVFLPTVNLNSTYTRRAFEVQRSVGDQTVTIQSIDALGASANASMTLFDPRLFPYYRQVRLDRDATQLDARNSVRLLGFEAANAFLATIGLDRVREAARRRVQYARETEQAARARVDAQLAGVNDVTKAELETATAERALITATGAYETARLQLALVLNAPADAPLAVPAALLEVASEPPPAADSLIPGTVMRRLDVAAARARAAALHYGAAEAELRAFPSLAAGGQYRVTNEAGLSGKSANWFVGATFSWTLFDGGVWWADMKQREALSRAAALNASELERRVAVEVRTALSSLANAQAGVRQARAALTSAQANATETAALYRQGLSTALAVADANVQLFDADVAYVRGLYDLALSYLDLRAALGQDAPGSEVLL